MANAPWNRRHVLSLADFTADELETVIQTAVSFREVLSRKTRKVPALQGVVVTNMFFEPSTRTRSSFELAAKRLSADVLNFAPGSSSLTKGETILDTAKTYLAMGTNLMVIRHQDAGVPQIIAGRNGPYADRGRRAECRGWAPCSSFPGTARFIHTMPDPESG